MADNLKAAGFAAGLSPEKQKKLEKPSEEGSPEEGKAD